MSAKVSKKFDKKFELNEESIRRIHSDIRKRVPEDKHKEIIFEIFREDSLVYRTSEIDRVLSESNDSTQKIKSVKIEYLDESLNIELIFDSVDGAKLTVVGEDRDTVYLISSELKEYIQKEVAFLFGGNLQSRNVLVGAMFISMLAILLVLTNSYSPVSITIPMSAALESTDLNVKMNYIISNMANKPRDTRAGFIMIIPVLLSFGVLLPLGKIMQYFFPGNIFLIGKQISIISNRRGFVRNIFWCVIVGSIIAMVTGYYFFWLSK
ncbi:hypothetical protein [Pseudomonas sp. NPDC087804]|uniref:hypothetical protein n=1 Tax=Pseudomonas sp. NPDC087804 TaxID=3364449 RepID=UPI0037F923C7